MSKNCGPAGFGQKGNVMNCWKISAQFAAYIWRLQDKAGQPASSREAARFARDNWVAFLPYADEGIGKLLIAIAKPGTFQSFTASRAKASNPAIGLSPPNALVCATPAE